MKKIYLITILLAIGTVCLAGASFYFWLRFNLTRIAEPAVDKLSPVLSEPLGKITNGENFVTADGNFRFRYPTGWFVNKNKKGVLNLPAELLLESWSLTNIKPQTQVVLSPGELKLDLEIWTNKNNRNLEEIFPCQVRENLECGLVEINSQPFRRILNQASSGQENLILAAIENHKVYRISILYFSQDKETLMPKIEGIINTFSFSI